MQHADECFFTKEFMVNSFFTDLRGRLSLPSLFSLFQEMAWEHATNNKFGYVHLQKQGLFWVLSRISVEILRMPNWAETFFITTWPSGVDGLFALRDFELFDYNKQVIVRATTSWLIVDVNSRRLHRLDDFRERMPVCETYRATKANAGRIGNTKNVPSVIFESRAAISDIDINGHINNTKYVEWAINSFSEEAYKATTIERITVNFLAEGFSGDELAIRSFDLDDVKMVSVVTRKSDGRSLAIVEIEKAL